MNCGYSFEWSIVHATIDKEICDKFNKAKQHY